MTDDELRRMASSGPAFSTLASQGPIDWTEWRAAATSLKHDLAGAADLDRRIHHLYLPVLFFCAAQARSAERPPVLIGLQAPQGAGKTTLVSHVLKLLPKLGLRGTGVSIDDFYQTRDQQLELAAKHPGNPYLEHRGYPGTHDVDLGVTTLSGLRELGDGHAGLAVRVPVYDKSKHGGRGDRTPMSDWREVTGPLDIVIVEGWMLGFTPVAEATLDDESLVEPNRELADYDRWIRLLDAFVVIRATDPRFVLEWRVQAEAAMAAQGRPALSRAAIEDYIRRFLPAYARYGGAPKRFPADRQLTIAIDRQRRAV